MTGAGSDAGGFDGRLYAANTAHHRAHDATILADVPLRPGLRVLDLGCGSGDLTATLADRVAPGGAVLGVDASRSQVEHARRAHGRAGLSFAACRAQDLAAVLAPASVDAVVSVAVLHWVPAADQPAVLAGVAAVLDPGGATGGLLRVDMGGHGQIRAAREVLDAVSAAHGGARSPWYFPAADEYADLAAAAGLHVRRARLLPQRRSFPTAEHLEGWLVSQVLPAYLPTVPPRRRAAFTADALAAAGSALRRGDGTYDQDYVRLDLLAVLR